MDEPAIREWARQHQAAWEIEPLVEVHEGERVQVGFEIDLYARVPSGATASSAILAALWDGLQSVAAMLAPAAGPDGRIEVEPFDAAERLRPETHFAPEIMLQARFVETAERFVAVSDDDRARLSQVERRLRELGLEARSW